MMHHDELAESLSRGSRMRWRVDGDYQINNGIVQAFFNGQVVYPSFPPPDFNTYLPFARPELPTEFARLADASDRGILKFVSQYGLLGYSQAYSLAESGAVGRRQRDAECYGDPVSWILQHARTVKLLLDLADAMVDPAKLDRQLALLKTRGKDGSERLECTYAYRGDLSAHKTVHRLYENTQEQACILIEHVLKENLEGVSRRPVTVPQQDGSYRLESQFSGHNLLDCLYWHISDAVTDSTIRGCDYCGRPFIAKNRRLKYCPPRMGLRGVSACMNSAKQDRYKKTAMQN